MSRILVVFASNYGQTCAIAGRIAKRLRETGHAVDIVDVDDGQPPDPRSYDVVVVGSRVQFGHHAAALVDYLRSNRAALMDRPTAFFSVSNAAATPGCGADPAGYMDATFAGLDWYPTEAHAFGGALPYRRYNWFLRQVMKRISRNAGHPTDTNRNHVFTDYAAVATFADRIARLLPSTQGVRPDLGRG